MTPVTDVLKNKTVEKADSVTSVKRKGETEVVQTFLSRTKVESTVISKKTSIFHMSLHVSTVAMPSPLLELGD